MKTILEYLRPKLAIMSLGLTIKLTGTMLELLLPWMLSVILDSYVPAQDMRGIILWGVLMVISAGAALACNVGANRMSTKITKAFTQKLRYDLFSKVVRLSSSQEDFFTTPSLISRLTSDTYNAHHMVDRIQRLGVRAPILLIGGIVVTFTIEPVLTLVLIGTMPLLALVVWLVSSSGVKLYTQAQRSLDTLVRRAQESIAGVRVIQALSKTGYEMQKFDIANTEVVTRERTASLLMSITNPVMNLLLNAGLTLVIVVGAFRVNNGVTQPGTVIAFLSYFTIILNAIMMVSRLFMVYSKGAASSARIAEVLNTPQDMPLHEQEDGSGDYHIQFEDVSFSYGKSANNLTNISFALKKGQTLGIIGSTGSGKTTLIQLLLRFYDADSGRVLINGCDVRSIPHELLHTMFGVVFQNDFLYADEIGENIDFGRGLAWEQIEKAAQTAQADFIDEVKGGFGTTIAPKGADLSGGQKQRVLIARALAAHPDILILDDSSSALDYKTDLALRRALAADFADTTKVIVAQRISSIKHSDIILVLDDGELIGSGTHDELMQSCESYRDIAEIQMGEVE